MSAQLKSVADLSMSELLERSIELAQAAERAKTLAAAAAFAAKPAVHFHVWEDEYGTEWSLRYIIGSGFGRRAVSDGDAIHIREVKLGEHVIELNKLGPDWFEAAEDCIQCHELDLESSDRT